MIRQSIERLVGLDRDNFERISNELDLTPEQKSKAEVIFQPLGVKRFQGIDTDADRAAAFAEFSRILTPEQRRKALTIYAKNLKADAAAPSQSKQSTTAPASQPSQPSMP